MFRFRKTKTKKIFVGLFSFTFLVSVFFLLPSNAQAGAFGCAMAIAGQNSAGIATECVGAQSTAGSSIFDAVELAFKTLLYGIFVAVSWLASAAVTLFGWVIDPNYISGANGFMNQSSVYDLWKFIRDFFNLFFILILLFSAFATIFQVEQFHIRKIFLNILLAALLANFSFPITRFLIDMTNVPMYYFFNAALVDPSKKSVFLDTVLTASHIGDLLFPPGFSLQSQEVSYLLMAIIFMFILAISLLVLALMFVVRLIALIILVIFSPIGFIAGAIPGLQKYAGQWWDNFWKYALFGPAAALMLLVAVTFMAGINRNDATFANIKSVATNASVGGPGFLASLAFFSIPIILIWFTIGLASSFSIAGAGMVSGLANKVLKGGLQKLYNNPVGRGLYGGVKKVANDGKVAGINYGDSRVGRLFTGKYWASPSKTEAAIKGGIVGLKSGAGSEIQKAKDKAINEQIKKDKEENLSRSGAMKRLKSYDEVQRVSAAVSLANMDNGIQSMDDLTAALKVLPKDKDGNITEAYQERAVNIVSKADKRIIAESRNEAGEITSSGIKNLSTVMGALGNNQKAVKDLIDKLDDTAFTGGSGQDYATLLNSAGLSGKDVGAVKNRESLERKMKKEGQLHVLVDYKANHAPQGQRVTVSQAIEDYLKTMKAEDIAEQGDLFTDPNNGPVAIAYMNQNLTNQQKVEVKKRARGNWANRIV